MRMEGTAWSFGGIAANTQSRCGHPAAGTFPAWVGVGGLADCQCIIKCYEESPNLMQFLAHVG